MQFEQPEERELKMILDGQNEIYRSLKILLTKLDEVVGRQERELSLLTMISQAQPQVPQPSEHRQVLISAVVIGTDLTCVVIYHSHSHPHELTVLRRRYKNVTTPKIYYDQNASFRVSSKCVMHMTVNQDLYDL